MARAASWPDRACVGRDALVDDLVAVAQRAAAGSGAVVVLSGEAGIGKTTVARAVAQRVGDELAVAWGTCTTDRSAPPFWPWRAVVDLPAASPSDAGDASDGEQRFERLTALRAQILERGPQLLVIEDLQWADVASVLLLAHVGAALADAPVVIVGTVRTGEPLARPLEAALDDVRRLALDRGVPPLPQDAISTLIRDAGIEVDSDMASLIRARTGGNPLYVTELIRAAQASGSDDRVREIVEGSVPARVAALIAHRLARLPAPVSDLVVTASVVATEGDARTLATIQGTDAASVVGLLEQARAARLMDAAPPGRWRFAHDLVRDAVEASLTDTDRARTHAAVLEALAADPATPPSVLARHALAAQPLFDAERAVALAARAGDAAFAQHAYEEAVGWFRSALGLTTPEIATRWRAELLVRCGEAHRRVGETDDGRSCFLDAAELTDDPALLAGAALGYADPGADLGIAYRTEDPETADLLERAIAAQPVEDSVTTVLLEARLAAELYFSDHPGRAHALADAAMGRARRLGDSRALGAAGAVVHDAFVVGQADPDVQLAGSAQLVEWADDTGTATARLTAHRARVFDLLAAGDLAGMDTEILAFRRVAEPLRSPGYLWWPALWSAMRALLEGRHDLAEERATEASELGLQAFPTLAFTNLSFLLFFLRREQGRLDEMEQATRDYAASRADVPAIRVALVLLLAETGRTDEAAGLLAALADEDLRRLRDRNWPASWFQLARATHLVGDRALARTLLDESIRPRERCVMVSLATACLGAVDLGTAWLLHTVGDLEEAEARYTLAADVEAGLGARSWLAHARAGHASLLLDRGRRDDVEAARRLTARAAAAADEIGLAPVAAEVARLHERFDASAGPVTDRSSAAPVERVTATLRRVGDRWDVDFAGRRLQVAHGRGLIDLAHLVARPHQAVSVLDLLGDAAPASASARGAPTLDERARREISERLRDLDVEVDEAEAYHDDERAAVAREERQRLAEAVARDLGLGGRPRRIDDPVERARKTVSTRLRRTIASLGRLHPELGRHLERSIDTGAWCAYRPAEPVDWTT